MVVAVNFKPIHLDTEFDSCVAFRKDAWVCSFDTERGFDDAIVGYRQRMKERLTQSGWYYEHIWQKRRLIGQLEYRAFSELPGLGYVHLFYLIPEMRKQGLGSVLQQHVSTRLREHNCHAAELSVSRTNLSAIAHYRRHGWVYDRPNPKHATTDFYRKML